MLRAPVGWTTSLVRTAAAVGALVTLYELGWLRFLESPVVNILSPVQATVYRTVRALVGAPPSPPASDQQLALRALTLEVELERLRAENARLREGRQQLDYLSAKGLDAVVAEVIGEEVAGRLTTLVVNRGARHGVRRGVPVLVREGVFIGKVVAVADGSSQVMLLSDPRSQTAGAIDGRERLLGVVTGELGLGLRMELVPKDSSVAVGDVVTSAGLERRIPRGLLIGHVAKLEPDTTGFFYRVLIQPPVSLAEVSVVSIPTVE